MPRIIPAGAGNSAQALLNTVMNADHPRRRGELRPTRRNTRRQHGSSPQARGTQTAAPKYTRPRRIIPAGAGNSAQALLNTVMNADHPRRRGELSLILQLSPRARGSSPQARGTHWRRHLRRRPIRIIPAGAGNSKNSSKHPPQLTDHPRRRGELADGHGLRFAAFGSSPQARGTRLRGGLPVE